MLVALEGDDIDKSILRMAFEKRPCLLIDCSNSANPYRIHIEEEWLDEVFVINAEVIYRFRDALKKVRLEMNKLKLKVLLVTSLGALYSYSDAVEDKNVIMNCWELLKELSADFEIFAAADEYSGGFADETWDTQFLVKEW